MTDKEKQNELMNKISFELKDTTLQQWFEILCKRISDLEKESEELKETIELKTCILEKEKYELLEQLKKQIEEHTKKSWLEEYLDANCDSKIEAHNSKIDIKNVCKKILEEVKNKIAQKQKIGCIFSDIDGYELKEIIENLGIEV